METSNRYRETGYDYPKYYLVECPQCRMEAMITFTGKYGSADQSKLVCHHCMFSVAYTDLIVYRTIVQRNCPCCGKHFTAKQDQLKVAPMEVSVPCPQCNFRAEYIPKVESYVSTKPLKGLKGDPFFGFPLWLQAEVGGYLFWAYNREHLEEIRAYVDAGLRERQSSYRMTMTARLPQFIKEAKNREILQRVIHHLQRKTKHES